MKKLLFILSAIFVSVMSWAQTANNQNDQGAEYTLNPYAYDLSSTWDPQLKILTINFTLNASPNLITDAGGRGIQVFAIDKETGSKYYILGPSEVDIKKAKGVGPYQFKIDLSSGKDRNGNLLPKDKELTWEVRVNGRNNTANNGRKSIANSDIQNVGWRPYSTHGVAIGKNYNNPNFGKIFVTESSASKPSGWDWLEGKIPSLLEYNPMKFTSTLTSDYAVAHKKTHQNSSTSSVNNFSNPEPHRVRISDDGRIFVTSYHYDSNTSVWEYVGNGQYNQLILHEKGQQKRIVAMDVKGSGENLKMLLCEVIPDESTYSSNKKHGQLIVREYSIGTSTESHSVNSGTIKAYYNDYRTSTETEGLIYQSYNGQKWSLYNEGLINVAYGKDEAIWLKIDFYINNTTKSRIIYYDGTNTGENYKDDKGDAQTPAPPSGIKVTPLSVITNGYGGGDGLLVKGDTLITAGQDRLYFYPISADGSLGNRTELDTKKDNFQSTMRWVNDFALDPAHNLYAVSASARNMMVVPLPYGGITTTPAPAGNTFVLSDPIPNILATDLRFAPDGNSDRYVFSFNVNTTPKVAQIRFYKSYGDDGENDMKRNLAKINADDYQGVDAITPSFVYDIPTNQLKQGKISVSLGMCGGTIEDGKINNGKLPRGEWYWSVYVEAPRKSSVFAPIYRLVGQTHATEGYERKHATVNNYPETDGFGNIIVAHNPQNTTNDATRPEKGLRIYGISDSGNDEHAYTNTDRYSLRTTYLNKNSTTGMLNYPRRMDVAPDGKVYIADEGSPTNDKDWKNVSNGAVVHVRGGVKVWDPAIPNNFTLFSDNKIFTATSVAFWNGTLYATNTYDEYVKHISGKTNYTKEQQANTSQYGWNGFVGYVLNKYTSPGDWDSWSGNKTDYTLGRGDASGNIAIVAMDKGIWLCQHKEHNRAIKDATLQPLADNLDGYLLSFVPYGSNTRTWMSCVENGVDDYDSSTNRKERADASDFSQKKTSPVQSTPGGGIAYKKVNGKEYLYVVNHDGNIAQLEITSWSGSGTTATPTIPIENIKILTTPAETKSTKVASAGGLTANWTAAYITSMTFDYAGNLVTTTGKNYHDGPQDIVIYTMPYDRVNAREIQAPNSCRMIPERVAQLGMNKDDLQNIIDHTQHEGCYVDLYRPLQAGMYNTICLPFSLTTLSGTPYQDADVRRFASVEVKSMGGEDVLYLHFETVNKMDAGTPYLIKPLNDIPAMVSFEQTLQFTTSQGGNQSYTYTPTGGSEQTITFQGVMVPTELEANPKHLFVVANNRLAESTGGIMLGFRAYFILSDVVRNMQPALSFKRPIATAVGNASAEGIDVEKFIREGRIYIRLDDQVYDLTGARVQ